MRIETLAVHGGAVTDPSCLPVKVPIYETAAFVFDSAEHAAALFDLEADGYRYSRISNPTNVALERRIAMLEGGVEALVVSSGQAALHYALLNLVSAGRNLVSSPQIYGTTHTLLAHFLPSMGVEVRFAASATAADMAVLVDENTRGLFCETIGNPGGEICDIQALAALAHSHGIPLVVDNTIATPALLRPIEHGADIVVHSLTKFLGGHGSTLGGTIVDSGKFDWNAHANHFPMFTQPDRSYHGLIYTERFGAAAYLARCRSVFLRVTGSTLSAMSAFLLLQGIETLSVRIDRHVENAARVAAFLKADRRVSWVNYAGFADNPNHELAKRYLQGRACSVFTFGLTGGFTAATSFYDALQIVKRVVNLGDVRSLACHPASTTHRQMTVEQQRAAGISPETIRISVGIEHVEDIIADINQALAAAAQNAAHLREVA